MKKVVLKFFSIAVTILIFCDLLFIAREASDVYEIFAVDLLLSLSTLVLSFVAFIITFRTQCERKKRKIFYKIVSIFIIVRIIINYIIVPIVSFDGISSFLDFLYVYFVRHILNLRYLIFLFPALAFSIVLSAAKGEKTDVIKYKSEVKNIENVNNYDKTVIRNMLTQLKNLYDSGKINKDEYEKQTKQYEALL